MDTPIKTRLRSGSNSSERRNSVSDISEIFQAKINNSNMPLQGVRKTSGRKAKKEKEKEREKGPKEGHENIKAYLNKMDNANGDDQNLISAESSINCESEHANTENGVVGSDTVHLTERDLESTDKDDSEKIKKMQSIGTQTNEDEILKALKEIALKYQQIDDAINDPKNGISYQLAKRKDTVTTLHSDIHGAVSGVEVRLVSVIQSAQENMNNIQAMEVAQKRITALLEENKRLIQELTLMQGLVQKVSQQNDVNSLQLLDLTKRGMEQNLVLYGVSNTIEVEDPKSETPMYTYKERCRYSALEFFKSELNVDLDPADIWKAHRVGVFKRDKVQPLVIKVSYAAKELIMDHLSRLKGRFNPVMKQKYFISEQIPEGVLETRKQATARLKPLKEANEKKSKENRDTLQAIGDKILVNGQVQEPEVATPMPAQLFLNPTEQKAVDEIQKKFVETTPEFLNNSEFQALAVKVHSIQEVKQAYIAAYQRYPTSDHIVLGYALKEEGKLKNGFCDDKEYGAGLKVKDAIFTRKSRNTAVFVLRK